MADGARSPYPNVPSSPRFPLIEEQVLASWASQKTFEASVEGRSADDEFVFYDGPPFANGLPHYGHLLTGYVKDVVPRYQHDARTARGAEVRVGLPWPAGGDRNRKGARRIGHADRSPNYGIEQFNDHCRTSVLRYTREWERYVTRQARWVDFSNDYKTMDLSYMESVMWALKTLWEKGLLYEDYRVLPYCWECETPLSNSETRQDDAYRDRQDPAVTVAFRLEPAPPGQGRVARRRAGSLGLDDHPLDAPLQPGSGGRAGHRLRGLRAWLLDLRPRRVGRRGLRAPGGGGDARRHGARPGPRRPFLPSDCSTTSPTSSAFVVLGEKFVNTDEGTGVVHMAPGFGEDDQSACEAAGIPVVCPVDDRTRFTAEVPDFEGMQVFEANSRSSEPFATRCPGPRRDRMSTRYPHCWRTDTPLVYRAVELLVRRRSRPIKDRMLEPNQEITWVPGARQGRAPSAGGSRTLGTGRSRGTASGGRRSRSGRATTPATHGSTSTAASTSSSATSASGPPTCTDPASTTSTRPNPDDPTGQSMMRRVSDVLDCWFESGSMPFAQVHYPFENQAWFDDHFPADFIVEYIGQTRGWFYTLHVLATALFDRPAFKTCLPHGIVLGDDGQKMSKRLRNYPDPEEMFDRHGADAMRWFLLSSPVLRGGDIIADEKGIKDAVRSALLPLWNAWYFFTLYANADGRSADLQGGPSENLLDRYILAKLHEVVASAGTALDAYDISGACADIEAFLDVLTNWYIRRSRDRFWGTGPGRESDTKEAFDTLGQVLEVLCRLMAPLMPLVAESIWTGLTGGASVHLENWPSPEVGVDDPGLVEAMDLVREVCSAAHSIRKANHLRARLPLASLTVAGRGAAGLDPFVELIKDEVNVREMCC